MMIITKKLIVFIFLITTLLMISSCTTTSYDSQSDQLLTKYAQNSNIQFFKLEREFKTTGKVPVPDQAFYDSLHSDLAVINLRMTALQKGEKAVAILDQQFESFDGLISDIQLSHTNSYNVANGKPENNLSPVKGKDFSPINFGTTRRLINIKLQTLISHEASLNKSQSSNDSK